MKTIIASAAVAVASLGVAGVASAQSTGGIDIVSPYVGIEHVTKPYFNDDDEWVRWGDLEDENGKNLNHTKLTAGTEVYLPYNLELDVNTHFTNKGADSRLGFVWGGANATIAYELDNGLELFSTTRWGLGDQDANGVTGIERKSTSFGAKWQF